MMIFFISAFILGLLIGSYLNVLIYRIPRDESTVFRRSYCVHCQKKIAWYENIPVISFLFLKGRCSGCHQKISWRYPMIELVTGLVFCASFPDSLSTHEMILWGIHAGMFSILLALLMIDLDFYILPDSLNIALLVAGILKLLMTKQWMLGLIGGGLGFIAPLSIAYFYFKVKKIEGLGGGDIKLYGVLGLILGPSVMVTIFLSSIVGIIFFILSSLKSGFDKDKPIPFGPSIILVAWAQIYFPEIFKSLF